MSDLIDRSAVLNSIEDWMDDGTGDEFDRGYDFAMRRAMRIIRNANAVDAVPVIRCKDCKWWGLPEGMYATENVKHCEFGRYMVASDGYCVYGEVKSNAAD